MSEELLMRDLDPHAKRQAKTSRGLSSYFQPSSPLRGDREAVALIDSYLAQLVTTSGGNWTHFLQEQVVYFKKLNLKQDYELSLTALDYYQEGGECKPRQFRTLEGLHQHLTQERPKTLRSRLLVYSMSNDRPCEHTGGAAVQRNTRLIVAMSAMLLSLVGAVWKIDAATLSQLGGFTDALPEPRASAIELPSANTLAPSPVPVAKVAITCPPAFYQSDYALYVANLHCKAPRCDPINVFFDGRYAQESESGYWQGVLACGTSVLMQDVVTQLSESMDPKEIAKDPRYMLRAAKVVVTTRGRDNLAAISSYLENNSLGKEMSVFRYSPSYRKKNYVLHLRDHLDYMERLFEPYATEDYSDPDWPATSRHPSDDQWKKRFKQDYTYLLKVAEDLRKQAIAAEELIQSQIDTKTSSRTTLFTVIAAIYLPLSLATSILGMNIVGLGQTGANGPAPGTNAAPAPKWWALVAIGLPLTVATILLPLSFDRLYRKVQDYAGIRPRRAKLLLWSVPVLVAIIVIVVTVLLEVTKVS